MVYLMGYVCFCRSPSILYIWWRLQVSAALSLFSIIETLHSRCEVVTMSGLLELPRNANLLIVGCLLFHTSHCLLSFWVLLLYSFKWRSTILYTWMQQVINRHYLISISVLSLVCNLHSPNIISHLAPLTSNKPTECIPQKTLLWQLSHE